MNKIKVEIILNKYNELEGTAKEKAFEEHKNFLWELGQEYEGAKGEMKTDYSVPNKEEVEESILINGYLFFENGELADCVTYTGNHKKKGITEFNFKGKIYKVEK
tara:strand:+ start:695 stop:1009 length:315 start_codon:yes stop_codon:yes gene_type:complete